MGHLGDHDLSRVAVHELVLLVGARLPATCLPHHLVHLVLDQEPVELLEHLDLGFLAANFSFLAAPFVPRQSATDLLRKTFFDADGEAVSLRFLARTIGKVELLVFRQSDLLVVAWQRRSSELPEAGGGCLDGECFFQSWSPGGWAKGVDVDEEVVLVVDKHVKREVLVGGEEHDIHGSIGGS